MCVREVVMVVWQLAGVGGWGVGVGAVEAGVRYECTRIRCSVNNQISFHELQLKNEYRIYYCDGMNQNPPLMSKPLPYAVIQCGVIINDISLRVFLLI